MYKNRYIDRQIDEALAKKKREVMVKTGDKEWGRWRAGREIQGRKVTRKRDSDVRDKKRGDDQGGRKREGKVQEVCFCFFFYYGKQKFRPIRL